MAPGGGLPRICKAAVVYFTRLTAAQDVRIQIHVVERVPHAVRSFSF